MGFFDVINHLFNFLLPAIAVAALMGLALRLPWMRRLAGRTRGAWHREIKINALVGAAALCMGLVVFGRDAKMATYGLLVVAMAASQWWLGRR